VRVGTATDSKSETLALFKSTRFVTTECWSSHTAAFVLRIGVPFLTFCLPLVFFFDHRPKRFWNDRKELSHFGQNVWRYRLMNTVMVSFNTTVRQMTEMFQWPKCLNKIRRKCLSENNRFRRVGMPPKGACTSQAVVVFRRVHAGHTDLGFYRGAISVVLVLNLMPPWSQAATNRSVACRRPWSVATSNTKPSPRNKHLISFQQ